MTIDEKINRLREAVNRLRRYTPAEDFGAEARACKRTAEGFGQEADWLEELKRYRELEEQGRLLVLPCKVGEHPEETRLTQFLKYYPNAVLNNDGTPHEICARNLGIREFKGCLTESCVDCWNTPIEEE